MAGGAERARAAALLIAASAVACGGTDSPIANEGGAADAGGDAATDAVPDGEDVEDLGDATASGGAVTQVVEEMSVLIERVCDFDGDGLEDNAVADLGSPSSTIFASVFDTLIRANNDDGSLVVVHIPWMEDLSVPHDPVASLIVVSAYDTDDPPDRSDDFTGDEPFWVAPEHVDACGEPRSHLEDGLRVVDGALETDPISFPLSSRPGLLLKEARFWGTMDPWGASASARACGFLTASDLAASAGDELSELEMLLAGGAVMGVATMPGLLPDLDLDGDGIERFQLDEEWRLESCIDGDATVIPGRDCAADDRIADGFSFTVAMESVSAQLAGLFPSWEDHVEGTCDDPPATSAWDPH